MKRTRSVVKVSMLEDRYAKLDISYNILSSIFGTFIYAYIDNLVEKPYCYAAFIESEGNALADLRIMFPNANFSRHIGGVDMFNPGSIHVKVVGTKFQLKVWKEIAKVQYKNTITYWDIANILGQPEAVRSVGTATGLNHVALLIPCHRIVPKYGGPGKYKWGAIKKKLLLDYEQGLIA